MAYAQFALAIWSITANLALALLAKQSKGHSALVNAKTTSFSTTRVTALPADPMKSFPRELVSAQLDTLVMNAECALFHADKDSSCSKEPVQSALSTLSSTLP